MDYRAWDEDSVFPSFTDPFFPAHLARYYFAARFLNSKKVLDLGCGKGYGSRVLAERARTVTAVDLNVDSIEFAKQNYSAQNIEFLLEDVREIAKRHPNTFDAVVSFEVLEHLSPTEASGFLMTLSSLLAPGGLLFLSTPNHEVVTKSGMPVPPFHINNLSSRELKTFLDQTFENVEMYGQVECRSAKQLALYFIDIYSLRHSKLIKKLRARRPSVAPISTMSPTTSRQIWNIESGEGPAQNFRFSKWLWRQAGMSFAICKK